MVLPRSTKLNDRFEIDGVLDAPGLFDIAYLALDLRTKERVVVTEYFPSRIAQRADDGLSVGLRTSDDSRLFGFGLELYAKEADVLCRLRAPGLAPVITFFEAHRTGYTVRPYYESPSLGDYVRQKGDRVSFRDVLAVVEPILEGLGALHEEGLFHGGVTPQRIYPGPTGQPVLMGVQAARLMMADAMRKQRIILEAGYAAPELYEVKSDRGPWTDVYGCAATMYRLMSGRDLPSALERQGQDIVPTLLRDLGLYGAQHEVFAQALALGTTRRPSSTVDFARLLRAAAEQPAVPVPPVPEAYEEKVSGVADEVSAETAPEAPETPAPVPTPAPPVHGEAQPAAPEVAEPEVAALEVEVQPEPTAHGEPGGQGPTSGLDHLISTLSEQASSPRGSVEVEKALVAEEVEAAEDGAARRASSEVPSSPGAPSAEVDTDPSEADDPLFITSFIPQEDEAEAPRKGVTTAAPAETAAPRTTDAAAAAPRRRMGRAIMACVALLVVAGGGTLAVHTYLSSALPGSEVAAVVLDGEEAASQVVEPAAEDAPSRTSPAVQPAVVRRTATTVARAPSEALASEDAARGARPLASEPADAALIEAAVEASARRQPRAAREAEQSAAQPEQRTTLGQEQLYAYFREQGDALFEEGEYAAARRKYEEALEVRPGDEHAAAQLQVVRLALRNNERAALHAEHLARGDRLFEAGQYAEAQRAYAEALTYAPSDAVTKARLARADERLAAANRQLHQYEYYRGRGDVLFAQQSYEAAIASYERALTYKAGDTYVQRRVEASREALDALSQEDVRVENGVYLYVDEVPAPAGGLDALYRAVRYPERARQAGVEGRVTVRFIVGVDGRATDLEVLRGIGHGCDQEALRAIQQTRFTPGTIDGRPVRSRHTMQIQFKLTK